MSIMLLENYYKRMVHLRIAQPLINDITTLDNLVTNFNRVALIYALSFVSLKYEKELQQIGFCYSGRAIIKGHECDIYSTKTNYDLIDDANYFIDCLILIGAVRFGMEKDIPSALNRLNQEVFA